MSEQGPAIDLRMQTTPEQADDFLFRVARDPEFRSRVESDPAAALREYGVEVSETTAPHLVQLPAPEDIDELRQRLSGAGEYAETGSVGAAWFIVLAWFFTVPTPGGDAPS